MVAKFKDLYNFQLPIDPQVHTVQLVLPFGMIVRRDLIPHSSSVYGLKQHFIPLGNQLRVLWQFDQFNEFEQQREEYEATEQ